jgi:hypothetical protein
MDIELFKMLTQRTPSRRYFDVIFGRLPKLCMPTTIVDKQTGVITLDNCALNVLTALLWIQRNESIRRTKYALIDSVPDSGVTVKADRKTLMRITGMSKNLVSRGIRALEEAKYICRLKERDEYQQFAASTFLFLNPKTGNSLETHSGESLLYGNGLHYFTIPACMFRQLPIDKPALYSFSNMSSSEKRLYIALTWLAKQRGASEFATSSQQLRTLTGLEERAFKKALDGLESRRLVWNSSTAPSLRNLNIVLRNPITQELLEESRFDRNPRNNACNWYEQDAKGSAKKADLCMSPEKAESLFLNLLQERGETAQREGNGELKFRCPFHRDSNPSCSFNPKLGCFHCFSSGCGAKGTTHRLLMQLSGTDGERTIRLIAEAKGQSLEYIDPDWDALGIYDYTDKFGNLKKQVLRLPNDDMGNKRFTQRRLGKDGWIYNVKGMKPMLFNASFLQYADTLLITEGEKDAVTITGLALKGRYGMAIGTTSGGSSSWDASLVKDLIGHRVVILPDDDDAGKQYADAIEESLKTEGIEYRRVSFSDTGAKDVTEYMENHSTEDLARLIGVDWIRMPDGRELYDPLQVPVVLGPETLDFPEGEITR